MSKKFSDTSPITVTDSSKFLAEGGTTDSFAHALGSAIFTYLNSTKKLLTQTEIEALSSLLKLSDLSNDSILTMTSGVLDTKLISELVTAIPEGLINGFEVYPGSSDLVVNNGTAYGINYTTQTKTWGVFSEGTGNGCLNASSLTTNKYYFVWLISKDVDGTLDIFCDLDESGTNIPSGWTEEFMIGSFYTNSSSNPESETIVKIKSILSHDKFGIPFAKNYYTDLKITKYTGTQLEIDNCFTRDDTNSINMRYYGTAQISVSGLTASTIYYLFQIHNNNGGDTGFKTDDNINGTNLTDDYKRIIGKFKLDINGNIMDDSILSLPDDKEENQIINYSLPLTTYNESTLVLEGEEKSIATGQTGNYTTDFYPMGYRVMLDVSAITTGGTCTITGSYIKDNGQVQYQGTEVITITTTIQKYLSSYRWYEVTDISFTTVVGITYSINLVGYETNILRDFKIIGYDMELMSISGAVDPDIQLTIEKISYNSSNVMTIKTLEDIELDSGGTQQIKDNTSRSYARTTNPSGTGDFWGAGRKIKFSYLDFVDNFGADAEFSSSDEDGFRIKLDGGGDTALSDVEFIILKVYTKTNKMLS